MKVLVTGVSGFLGKALVLRLLDHGHHVVGISRREVNEVKHANFSHLSIDLVKQYATEFLSGIDVIFHVAAKVDMWGDYNDFYLANYVATKNLLVEAKKAGVKYFIYTSSPSVVANGKDLIAINESQAYPKHYEAYYPRTKAMAEKFVLSENSNNFYTVALRPHLIFGPGDTNLLPTVLEKADLGKLMQVGDGENLSDFTYIDDCVEAHICALNSLIKSDNASGKAYFISQAEPYPLWQWINDVLQLTGRKPITKKVSFKFAYFLATIFEAVWKFCKIRSIEPPLTRFLVSEMATSHYFDISASFRDLGFKPRVTIREGIKKAVADLKSL